MSFDDNSGRRDNRRFGGGYRGGGRRFNNDREFDDRPKPDRKSTRLNSSHT